MTVPELPEKPANNTPSSTPMLQKAIKWDIIAAIVIAVVGGVIGWFVDGQEGVASALMGAVVSVAFMAITAASILLANRFANSDLFVGAFFGIVLGGWLLKFVLFLVFVFVMKDQAWVSPVVLFLSIIAGVLASLIIDVVVILRTRMPNVSDAKLP